jgi:hypothetical protein
MNDPKTRDLVDRYLLNVASPEEINRLSEMRSADPLFNRYVEECEATFNVIQSARTMEFRKKLKAWDAAENRKRKKGVLLLITIVLCFLLFWSWVVVYFSPQALATRSFQRTNPYPDQAIIYDNPDIWNEGRNAFLRQQFQVAHTIFSELKSSTVVGDSTAKWNMLLCEFAQYGVTGDMEKKFQSFSLHSHEPLQKEATRVYQVMKSPLYQLLYTEVFTHTARFVKPRII